LTDVAISESIGCKAGGGQLCGDRVVERVVPAVADIRLDGSRRLRRLCDGWFRAKEIYGL
jgi:hypothetical protein